MTSKTDLFDTAMEFILSQPSLAREMIGGWHVVNNAVVDITENHFTVVWTVITNYITSPNTKVGLTFARPNTPSVWPNPTDVPIPERIHLSDRSWRLPKHVREADLGVALRYLDQLLVEGTVMSTSPAPSLISDCYAPITSPQRYLGGSGTEQTKRVVAELYDLVRAKHVGIAKEIFLGEFSDTQFDFPTWRLRTYDRHEDNPGNTWNFIWRDFAIEWYGRMGRDLRVNRLLTLDECEALLSDVRRDLDSYPWPAPYPEPRQPTEEELVQIDDKLRRNGVSGSILGCYRGTK